MSNRNSRRPARAAVASFAVAALALTGALAVPTSAQAADLSPYDAVNVWIGTAKDPNQNKANDAFGNTWPGATLPFGMVQFSPTTTATSNTGWMNEYGNDGAYMTSPTDIYIRGFGMTRLSGTGCNDRFSGFDLPFVPYTGTVNSNGTLSSSPGSSDGNFRDNFASQFKHEDEVGAPGYYSVKLDSDGGDTSNTGAKDTTVELTATTRTGVAKIDFPSGKNAAVLFNASGANNYNGASEVTIDPASRTISGYATAKTVCNEGSYRIFFSTTFDQPFEAVGQWQDSTTSAVGSGTQTVSSAVTTTTTGSKNGRNKFGVVLKFADGADVEMRTGISYVSAENAALNRTTEAPSSKNFASLRADAKSTWESALGTIDVTGGTDKERTKFYTGLYHSLLHPNIYEDVNGQYRGYYKDSKAKNDWPTSGPAIKQLAAGQQHEYVTYSSWDSLRGQMQLIAMLFPKVGSDMAASIYNMSDQVGTWYNWPHLGAAQKKMEGDGMQSIVASLYAFGSTDFDAVGAVDSMVEATSLGKPDYFRANFRQYAGTTFIEDRWTTATSTTMDYAMADFGVAQLAQRVGKDEVRDSYMTRAQNWRSLVSQDTAYPNRIVPRDRSGFWGSFNLNRRSNGENPDNGCTAAAEGAAPNCLAQGRDQFDQSTGLQYQWYMTQNMAGVIDALGGKTTAESKLDSLFNYPTLNRLDVSGSNSNGAYMSNQPSMHAPWVYNWLGKPAKATQVLDKAISTMYYADAVEAGVPSPANPGFANSIAVGLPGNDDLGSLSSWYVWANIGLYPAIFGRSELLVTTPNFDKVVITSKNLDGTITAPNAGGRTITINAPGQDTNRYISGLEVKGHAWTKSWLPEWFAQKGGRLDFTLNNSTANAWGTAAEDAPPSFNSQRNEFNAVGTANAGVVNAGSLDVGGVTLPRTALPAPGAQVEYGGIKYQWPDAAPLQPDHWVPQGQELDFGGQTASTISFLGTATNGPSTGTATVVYTDDTTTVVPITLPDWTGGGATDQARITGVGRLNNTGGLDSSTWRIYSIAPVALQSKPIAKVVLPKDVNTGLMHIFAVGTDVAPVTTPVASFDPVEIADPGDAAIPDIVIGTPDVSGGQPFTLSGSGAEPGTTITVTIGTTPPTSSTVTVGASGTFDVSVTLGAVPAGSYPVTVTVTPPGGTGLTVNAGNVTVAYTTTLTGPDRVERGKAFAFTGTGFAAGEQVTVTLGSATVTVTATSAGTIGGSIAVPDAIGVYQASAIGAVSEVGATAPVVVVHPVPGGTQQITPTVTLTSDRSSSVYGKAVTLRASVPAAATGRIAFFDGKKALGTRAIANGRASLSVKKLAVGKRRITAVYLGSATYRSATSKPVTVRVAKATTKKVTVTAKRFKSGTKPKVTVRVAKLNNGTWAKGTVRVRVGKKVVRTVKIAPKNKGKVTVTLRSKYRKAIKVKATFVPKSKATVKGKSSKTVRVRVK